MAYGQRMAGMGLVLAVALGPTGCGESRPFVPSQPDLAGLEPPVAQTIRAAFERARADRSGDQLARYARVLHAHGMLEFAVTVYGAAAERGRPALAFECLHLAGVAACERTPARAAALLRRATALRADYAPTWLLLGRVEEALGNLAAARGAFEQADTLQRSSHSQLGLARVLLAEGRPDAAHEHLNEALRQDPQHREVFAALARCLAQLGHEEMSEAAAVRAGRLRRATPIDDPLQVRVLRENVSSEALMKRAQAFVRAGRRAEAVQVLGRVLSGRPRHARALELRGRLHGELGDWHRAREDARALLALEPDSEWAQRAVGR